MKKMNFYSKFASCCSWMLPVLAFLWSMNLQAQSCVGGSPTSPGANLTVTVCSGTGTAVFTQDVLVFNAGATSVNLYSLGGTPIANTGNGINPFIGKVIRAEAVNGGTTTGGITTGGTVVCWGYILLEDKTPPTITCPADITLDCMLLDSVTNLNVTGEFNGATNAQGPTGPTGTVVECSKYTQSYTDVVTVNLDCPGIESVVIRRISRTWTVKDVWGNTSAPCTQIITVTRTPRDRNLFRAADVAGSCTVTDFSPAALNSWPFYDANGNTVKDANEPFIIIGASPICNVQNTGFTDQVLPLCNGGRKIIRTFTIVDMCQTGAAMIINVTQILTFTDVVPPTVSTTYQNYDQVAGNYCFNMYQNGTNMPMTQNTVTTKLLVPVTQTAGAAITLVPLADANVCNMATVNFTMVASDPTCGNNNVTFSSSDSRVRFNGGSSNAAVSVAGGSTVSVSAIIMKSQGTTFSITVTDGCGNSTTQAFIVNIIDNVTPQTVCVERTRATLGSDGRVRIFAATFNNGSSDNCGVERIQVRRMNIGASNTCGAALIANPDPCFFDYVDFNCSDVGRTDVMVIVRAVDAAGNFSDCMVVVNVDDKTGPICMAPQPITRFCTDPTLSSFRALFTRPAAFDNCGVTLRDSTISNLVLNCGKGTSTAVWTFQDCAGTTTTCSQVLTVNTIEGFRVQRICDSTSTCSSTSNGLAIGSAAYDTWLKNKIIAEIQLLNGVGVELNSSCVVGSNNVVGGNIPPANGGCTPNGGTVAANQKTCSAPVVKIEKWQFSSSQYCQIFRYRITVLDFCNPRTNYTSQLVYQGSAAQVEIGGIVGACTTAGSYYQDDRGVVVFERFVYVNDVTAPVSIAPANVDSCIYAGCNFSYNTTLTASDNCGGTSVASDPAVLTFMWRAINKITGAQIATGNTATVSLSSLAFGTYTICYRVSDLCGNMSQEYCYDVKARDCKKPSIVCSNVNAELMPLTGTVGGGGSVIVPIEDILSWATDNCSDVKTYLVTTGRGILQKRVIINGVPGYTQWAPADGVQAAQAILFSCNDTRIGTAAFGTTPEVDVQVTAVDAAGNIDFCVAKVRLQNNMGACGSTVFSVSGSARTEANAVVNNVTVSTSVNGAAVGSATATNGTFNISMAPAANVQVRAAKNNNDDAAQGVTTFDIAKMSQHVLDIEKFTSPYQMIAADVDKSGEIDATDMLHTRRFILKITPSLPGGNFRFIDKAYTFRNAANPFGEDFPEVVNIATLNANTAANFVAVKLGDVNGTYSALAPRSSRTLTFLANDMNVVAGNEYTVNISTDKLDAAAFQGTFSFNGATVKSVKAGNLNNMTDGNFGVFANAVTTSWNGKTQDVSDVLAITFVANKSGKLSEILTVNSALTQAVANDVAGNEMNVNLKFNTGKVAGGEFALYQNQPNPVANETTIGFNLPKDGQARLTITAVDGKVVKVLNGTYKAGYNTVTVNKSDLNASGVFYYRLETADHSASKKMVIIE